MLLKSLFVAGLIFLWPCIAVGGWAWTEWEMPKADLIASFKGTARAFEDPNPNQPMPAELVAPVSMGKVEAWAFFKFFSEDLLARVEIRPRNASDCPALLAGIMAELGEGEGMTMGEAASFQWKDKEEINLVSYVAVGAEYCTLEYGRLAAEAAY